MASQTELTTSQLPAVAGLAPAGQAAPQGKHLLFVDNLRILLNSGLKVYPREVEEVLFKHPAVAEVAVAGATDAYRGETVAAFVVLKAGIEASEETRRELLQYCKQELAAYKVPTILESRASLPKSLIGKVMRRGLHQAFEPREV